MADNYDDIRGMQFQYVTEEGFEFTCYLAAISHDRGLTIKAIDIDETEKVGYDGFRGTKDEGNMTCINLIDQPFRDKDFNVAVETLRKVKSGDKKAYNCSEIEIRLGRGPGENWGIFASCAF